MGGQDGRQNRVHGKASGVRRRANGVQHAVISVKSGGALMLNFGRFGCLNGESCCQLENIEQKCTHNQKSESAGAIQATSPDWMPKTGTGM